MSGESLLANPSHVGAKVAILCPLASIELKFRATAKPQ
jgi:hypothetical protein